jgi:hypothetical protein
VYYNAADGDFKEGQYGIASGQSADSLTEETKHLLLTLKEDVKYWVGVDPSFQQPLVTLSIEPWTYVQAKDPNNPERMVATDQIAQKRVQLTMIWINAKGEISTAHQEKYLNRNGIVEIGTSETRDK